MDKDLLLWLYEQKDDIDAHLYGTGSYSRAEGTYRQEIFAQMNLLDKIIRHVKKGQQKVKFKVFLKGEEYGNKTT